MSTTFIVTLILAVVVLGNLRLFLLIGSAVVLALVVTGIGTVSGAMATTRPSTTVIAPAQPGQEPETPGQSDDPPPQAGSEPPR